jgi:hypothetical protein
VTVEEQTFIDNVRVGVSWPALAAIAAGLVLVAAVVWLVCRR